MKKPFGILLALAALTLSIVSCSNDAGSPITPSSKSETPVAPSSVERSFEFVEMPHNPALSNTITAKKWITKNGGGEIILEYKYKPVNKPEVSVKATLKFLPNTVTQDGELSISLDAHQLIANVTFGPHGSVFLKPAILNLEAKQVTVTSANLSLYYVSGGAPSTWVKIQTKEIIVKTNEGYINAIEAKLNHFSQYAFGRVTDK